MRVKNKSDTRFPAPARIVMEDSEMLGEMGEADGVR